MDATKKQLAVLLLILGIIAVGAFLILFAFFFATPCCGPTPLNNMIATCYTAPNKTICQNVPILKEMQGGSQTACPNGYTGLEGYACCWNPDANATKLENQKCVLKTDIR